MSHIIDIPLNSVPVDLVDDIVLAEIRYSYAKLAIQATVTLGTIGFSAAMLATRTGMEGVYLPIITAVVGFWVPSPAFPISRPPPK